MYIGQTSVSVVTMCLQGSFLRPDGGKQNSSGIRMSRIQEIVDYDLDIYNNCSAAIGG